MKKYFLIGLFSIFSFSEVVVETATFAGGCFWCVEADLEKVPGVLKVVSGYAGGVKENPTYNQVSYGKTKHLEVVQVQFDKNIIPYDKLLIKFIKTIDPTDNGGQFVDRGYQYTSAIFYHSLDQKKIANKLLDYLKRSKKFTKIVTPIREYTNFYRAEDYHQDFYKKNEKSKRRYQSYRKGSGRDKFINTYWKDMKLSSFTNTPYKKLTQSELKKKLSKLQFYVTQEDGTEKPFKNTYWDNKKEGIYVDIVSGEPLFSSLDKFKSGTGWPSFTKPISENFIVTKQDNSLFSKRIEVRSKFGDSHLGHVFRDGPKPLKLRYCINSASLRFIRKEKMAESGYVNYLHLFEN